MYTWFSYMGLFYVIIIALEIILAVSMRTNYGNRLIISNAITITYKKKSHATKYYKLHLNILQVSKWHKTPQPKMSVASFVLTFVRLIPFL